MTKGSSVIVEGSFEQDVWEKDGQKHSEIIVIADRIYPTYKKGEGNNGGGNNAPQSAPQNSEGFQEDLPF